MINKKMYINGEWVGEGLPPMPVENPANHTQVGSVPKGGQKEAREAIDAAHDAFSSWSMLTAYERSAYLEKLYDLMIKNEDDLAHLMVLEMGKPMKDARGEVLYASSFIKWFSEEGKRAYGRQIPADREGKLLEVIKQPVGVVGAITPWNFPAAMITRKLGPALAAGCTIVIKPPTETPLTAIRLAELCEEAGIPKGVVNVITGEPSVIGDEMLSNEKVRKITFTGSTEVGKMLMKKGIEQLKKYSMELGGHAPMIVLDDANLDVAVKGVLASKFRNSGQTCIAGNRVYVQKGIYPAFLEKCIEETKKLKLGNPIDEDTDIGPLINKEGYEKVEKQVQDAIEKGAKCALGGKGHTEEGFYFEPTILDQVTSDMLIMQEETFGPVIPIQPFESDEEAIQLANHTPYGLAAYLFTENYRRAIPIIRGLNFGIIGWNDGVPSAAEAPFGGMKQSGVGREGGIEGLEAYLETKYISTGF